VPSLPRDIVFDVALRLIGLPVDSERGCELEIALAAPTFEEIGRLPIPVKPRAASATHVEGSEINHHVIARIDFEAIECGSHHLEFKLDNKAQPHVNTALTVVQSSV